VNHEVINLKSVAIFIDDDGVGNPKKELKCFQKVAMEFLKKYLIFY